MLHVIVDYMKRDGTHCDTRLHVDAPSGLGGSSLLPRKNSLSKNAVRLVSIENNCSGNVFMNKKAFERLAGKPLRVACGSFGVIKDRGEIWWEWGTGQEDSPVDEFLHCKVQPGKQNAHFWLEDPVSGCVYDVLPKYVLDVVLPFHNVHADLDGMICGVVISETRESLMKRGFVYLPLDERKQREIIDHRMSRMVAVRSDKNK